VTITAIIYKTSLKIDIYKGYEMIKHYKIYSYFFVCMQLTINLYASEEDIVNNLKDNEIISKSYQIDETIIPNSSSAEKIIFLKSNDHNDSDLALKIFKSLHNFEEEKELINSQSFNIISNEIAEFAKQNTNIKLPILVTYKYSNIINGKGIVLMDKAKGRKLEHIFDEVENMSYEDLEKTFSSIGEQLGLLNAFYFEKYNGQVLPHPDDSSENYLYCKQNQKLYFIDFADIIKQPYSRADARFILSFSKDLFRFSKSELSIFTKNNIENALANEDIKENQINEIIESIYKRYIAYDYIWDSFFNEMKNHLKDQDKNNKLKENYKQINMSSLQMYLYKIATEFIIPQGKFDLMQKLLDIGVNINFSKEKLTMLHWAVLFNKSEIVDLLIKNGAITKTKNNYDTSPLDVARKKNFKDIENMLLKSKN
jgi:hypothetical protein